MQTHIRVVFFLYTDATSPTAPLQATSAGEECPGRDTGTVVPMRFSNMKVLSIVERLHQIFIERLRREGSLYWHGLSNPEKRLVNYNPSLFGIFIDLPGPSEPRVRLLSPAATSEQVDQTGQSGKLRRAFDQELEWLTAGQTVFDRRHEDVRAVDQTGQSGKLRRAFDQELEWLTAGQTVFDRRHEDVRAPNQPKKYRCVCLDHNAIYSLSRSELFRLPDECSVSKIPTNAFLARFRGTFYVYENKYDEISDTLCQPDDYEGKVEFIKCAIYGTAPDGLTIVDACLDDMDVWVSELLLRDGIAAALENDPEVKLTTDEAEKMFKCNSLRRAAARRRYPEWSKDGKPEYRKKERKNMAERDVDKPNGTTRATANKLEIHKKDPDVAKQNVPTKPKAPVSCHGRNSGSLEEQLKSLVAPWTTDEGIFPLDDQEDAPEKYRPSLWMPTPDRTPRSPVTSTTHSVEGGCLKSPVTVEPPTPMVQKEGKNVHSGASSKAERGSGVAKIEAVSKKSPVRLLCAEGKEPGSEEMELGSVATVQEEDVEGFLTPKEEADTEEEFAVAPKANGGPRTVTSSVPPTSSRAEAVIEDGAAANLQRLLDLYLELRGRNDVPSSTVKNMDTFLATAIISAGRSLIVS
ncbi:unnamed protein product [Heligmosomoides polygyrus]|uniref:mRNA_cap_enzyme domain-containing protein n=1 Tax=Heligmosomoides polygyrus TaxID=6339 RepID=A0A3P8D115_HELPZ|nr:unnamed protein product [Heligmosomoides polygyrus]